jgi:hypothetical protein
MIGNRMQRGKLKMAPPGTFRRPIVRIASVRIESRVSQQARGEIRPARSGIRKNSDAFDARPFFGAGILANSTTGIGDVLANSPTERVYDSLVDRGDAQCQEKA